MTQSSHLIHTEIAGVKRGWGVNIVHRITKTEEKSLAWYVLVRCPVSLFLGMPSNKREDWNFIVSRRRAIQLRPMARPSTVSTDVLMKKPLPFGQTNAGKRPSFRWTPPLRCSRSSRSSWHIPTSSVINTNSLSNVLTKGCLIGITIMI